MALKGRFEKGEDEIAKSPARSYRYAKEVLKGRFKKGEPAIATEGDTAMRYVLEVLGERFPEAERLMKNTKNWDIYKAMYID
jgi:hypothetical protein